MNAIAESFTLFGFNGEDKPSALLKMGNEGWIEILYVNPEERNQGLGVQLIGQAVQKAMEQGEKKLRIQIGKKNPAILLLEENAFTLANEQVGGKVVLEKDLSCEVNF